MTAGSGDHILDLEANLTRLDRFAKARDWWQFHSPKNLSKALGGETGELLELFQWLTEAESEALRDDAKLKGRVAEGSPTSSSTSSASPDLPAALDGKLNSNESRRATQ